MTIHIRGKKIENIVVPVVYSNSEDDNTTLSDNAVKEIKSSGVCLSPGEYKMVVASTSPYMTTINIPDMDYYYGDSDVTLRQYYPARINYADFYYDDLVEGDNVFWVTSDSMYWCASFLSPYGGDEYDLVKIRAFSPSTYKSEQGPSIYEGIDEFYVYGKFTVTKTNGKVVGSIAGTKELKEVRAVYTFGDKVYYKENLSSNYKVNVTSNLEDFSIVFNNTTGGDISPSLLPVIDNKKHTILIPKLWYSTYNADPQFYVTESTGTYTLSEFYVSSTDFSSEGTCDVYKEMQYKPLVTVNPTPSTATVKMLDDMSSAGWVTTNSLRMADLSSKISYEVSATDYVTKTGSVSSVTTDQIISVSLEKSTATLTITPTPSSATVVLVRGDTGASVTGKSVTVPIGTKVTYTVSASGYTTKSGSTTVTSNSTIKVTLAVSAPIYYAYVATLTKEWASLVDPDEYKVYIENPAKEGLYLHMKATNVGTSSMATYWVSSSSQFTHILAMPGVFNDTNTYPMVVKTVSNGVATEVRLESGTAAVATLTRSAANDIYT